MTRHIKYVSRLTYPFVYKAAFPKADTEALPVTSMMLEQHDAVQERPSTYW